MTFVAPRELLEADWKCVIRSDDINVTDPGTGRSYVERARDEGPIVRN